MVALVRFDDGGGWGETLVCEPEIRKALARAGAAWGRGRPPRSAGGVVVHRVAGGPLLVYVAESDADGWLGVLCEPGEYLVLPAQGMHVLATGGPLPQDLPDAETFVEELLELTGHAAVE